MTYSLEKLTIKCALYLYYVSQIILIFSSKNIRFYSKNYIFSLIKWSRDCIILTRLLAEHIRILLLNLFRIRIFVFYCILRFDHQRSF